MCAPRDDGIQGDAAGAYEKCVQCKFKQFPVHILVNMVFQSFFIRFIEENLNGLLKIC